MTDFEISTQTLDQLRETFLKMTSPEWDLALIGKSEEVVNGAAMALLLVQRARLRLENAELTEIRDKLVDNEKGLEEGRTEVNKALDRLDQIEGALNAITSFLAIVGRVISLA